MALSYSDFTGMGQAATGAYRYGLGAKAKPKACCASCAHSGPCASDDHPHFPCAACGKARPTDNKPCPWCKRNMGWAKCGGVSGSRAPTRTAPVSHSTTVIQGQADLEPGDYGYQFPSTTQPGTTVFGRRQGFVDPSRRIEVTRMVTELEFLAGTPGVHPRALASKLWQARKALMGIGNWEWANYQNPGMAYDSKEDLELRLAAVERVLGVAGVSPKIMSQLYGMSGLGEWNPSSIPTRGNTLDPISKLAACIQGALCLPKSLCCPRGSCFTGGPGAGVPFATAQPQTRRGRTRIPENGDQTWIPREPQDTWVPWEEKGDTGLPLDPGDTWTPWEKKGDTGLPLDQTKIPLAQPKQPLAQPKQPLVNQQTALVQSEKTVLQQAAPSAVVQPQPYVGINHVPGFPGERFVVVVGTFPTAQAAIAAGAQSAVPEVVWAKQQVGYTQITPAQAAAQAQRMGNQAAAARALAQQGQKQKATTSVPAPRPAAPVVQQSRLQLVPDAGPGTSTTGVVRGGVTPTPRPQVVPIPQAQVQSVATGYQQRAEPVAATQQQQSLQQSFQQGTQQILNAAQLAEQERRRRAGLVAGAGGAAMLGGLGAPVSLSHMPALQALRQSMQQTRRVLQQKRRRS